MMKGSPDLDGGKLKKKVQKDAMKQKCDIANLHYLVSCSKKDNFELQLKLENTIKAYEEKISRMQTSFWKIIKTKEEENQKKIDEILNNNILLPKKTFENFPFLEDMINYSFGGKPTEKFSLFCQFFFLLNRNSYVHLRNFLPLIPDRTLFDYFQPLRYVKRYQLRCPCSITNNVSKNLSLKEEKEEPIHITLGGDAASIKVIPESGLSAIYTHMVIPLKKDLKPLPIQITPTTNGSSNKSIVDLTKYITTAIEKNGQFIVDYIATDGDKGFDSAHLDFFAFIEPILNLDIPFINKIEKMLNFIHIPVNDGLHLLKNGRSHLLNHPLMVDPKTMRIVNVELFQKATKINKAINDRSSIASMKDFYALELFSWKTFYDLVSNKRFDGAFYLIPFVYFIQAIKSNILNRNERLQLLEVAIKYLTFHLKNVRQSKKDDFFTPSFTQKSIGTLFGEEIYIIRFIDTCVALSIAIMRQDEVAFSRISTHDIEGFFGMIRILSYFNYSFENALRAAINSWLIKDVCAKLDYKYKIRNRINESGAYVQSDVLNSESHEINFELIADTIFLLLRGIELSKKQIGMFCENLDKYNKLIEFSPETQISRFQSVFSGTNPHYRNVTNSYVLSMLPLPSVSDDVVSPFSFYYQRNKRISKNVNKISTIKWFNQFLKTVLQMITRNEVINIPQFPNFASEDENENDNDFLIGSIFQWLNEVIIESNDESQIEIKTSSNAIKSITYDFEVKIEEVLDITKASDLINSKCIIKKEPKPYHGSAHLSKGDIINLYKEIEDIVSQYIGLRTPILISMTKDAVREKLLTELKYIVNALTTDNRYSLIDQLNAINLENCMTKPIHHSEETSENDFLTDNDLDILSNRFDFNNNDDNNNDDQVE